MTWKLYAWNSDHETFFHKETGLKLKVYMQGYDVTPLNGETHKTEITGARLSTARLLEDLQGYGIHDLPSVSTRFTESVATGDGKPSE